MSNACISINFLCTYATNDLDQHGNITTLVEGVWKGLQGDNEQTRHLRVETGQHLNPESFSNHCFYRAESSRFTCENGTLQIESDTPERINDLSTINQLATQLHDFMAARQQIFLHDDDELKALGLMIIEPGLRDSFMATYANYVFSTPQRQCLFMTIRALNKDKEHLSGSILMEYQTVDNNKVFRSADIGLAVNTAETLSWEYRLKTLYQIWRLDAGYEALDGEELYFEYLKLKRYQTV
jgi:hypothetical protein